MNAEGIPCNSGYKPLHTYPFIAEKVRISGETNVAEKASYEEAVWIPQYVLLGDEPDLLDVVQAFEKLKSNG